MPSDDEIIAEAQARALAKRRVFYGPKPMKVTPELLGMIRPPDSSYCPVCDYPQVACEGGPCLYCWQQKLADKEKLNGWIEAIGGRKAWEDYTLSAYKITQYNQAAVEAARGFDPRRDNLFFHGPRGTGKSHAAAIAKRPLVTSGARVLTVSMPLVIDEVLAGIKSGGFAALTQQWIKTLTMQPILNLEDIAVEKPSDHALGFYYKFINQRYLDKRNGIIITSNYSLDELENRWAVCDSQGRVTSRLKEMCKNNIHSFAGLPDFREGA